LPAPESGQRPNHPANIATAFEAAAAVRRLSVEDFTAVVRENFARLFGV
jgi:Tat protein secretion system quality control protein TatD with DNase activity